MQDRRGRRGAVFSVRITDEQRGELEARRAAEGGPRALGPWLLWRVTAAPIVPELGYCPSSPPPREVLPRRRGNADPEGSRLILDLCSGSGAWSAPYVAAGYEVVRVSLPECDVRTFLVPSRPVWGVLAAPPCDQFSLARNGHPTPRDFVRGMEVVNACMRVIAQAAPRWWALENPVGLLSRWLGTPRDVFEPCDFGDPWTKRTALWGEFTLPSRGPFVRPLGGGPLCADCDPGRRRSSWCNNAAHRARTPPGFARAFFEANP